METIVDMENALVHLNSIKCEISNVKYNLCNISSKVEYQINIFISIKENLRMLASCDKDVESFDKFFEDVKQEVSSANTKVALLEQETNSLALVFEENLIRKNDAKKSIKTERDNNCKTSENEYDEFRYKIEDLENYILDEDLPLKTISTEYNECNTISTDIDDFQSSNSKNQSHCGTKRKVKERLECGKCWKNFHTPNILHMHVFEEHSMSYFRRYKCEICSVKYVKLRTLREHKEEKHKQNYPFQCVQCGKRFMEKTALKTHEENVHESKSKIDSEAGKCHYECSLCSKTYKSLKSLIRHKQSHSEELFQCPTCEREYNDVNDLKKHFSLHTKENLKCHSCEMQFNDSLQLTTHLEESHNFILPKIKKVTALEMFTTSINEKNSFDQLKFPKCQVCGERFVTICYYIEHRKSHKGSGLDEPFDLFCVKIDNPELSQGVAHKCNICEKYFKRKSDTERHLLTHTMDKPFGCDVCQVRYRDPVNLKKHFVDKHSGDKPFICSICDQSFESKILLMSHMETHNAEHSQDEEIFLESLKSSPEKVEFQVKCQICLEIFPSLAVYMKHKKKHVGSVINQESTNGESPGQFAPLDLECDRVQNRNGSFAYKCPICQKKFPTKVISDCHMFIHTGEKPFCCDTCGIRYKSASNTKNHIIYKHRGEKRYKCNVCSRNFCTKGILKEHKWTHTGEKPYQCVTCGKFVANASYLQLHMRMHTGIRSHSCDQCSYKCYNSSQLRWHVKRKHLKIRPYTCEYCGKSFQQTCHLVEHTRMHTGEKPYECSICKKSYRVRKDLKDHMDYHTGTRYTCQVCGKNYGYKKGLRLHLKTGCGNFSEATETFENQYR